MKHDNYYSYLLSTLLEPSYLGVILSSCITRLVFCDFHNLLECSKYALHISTLLIALPLDHPINRRKHSCEPGKCSFFGVCTALEAHQRLKTDKPCPELSSENLESKVNALTDVKEIVGLGFIRLHLQYTVDYCSRARRSSNNLAPPASSVPR